MITDPDALRVLCFGDSNTYGTCRVAPGIDGSPTPDPDYVRLHADRRWPGVLQRLLGQGYDVIEEGLNGRTTDQDEPGRPGRNGRAYFLPCLLSHQPLEAVVVMLGGNDLKPVFGRTPQSIAEALGGYVEDVADMTNRRGGVPTTVLVGMTTVDVAAPQFRDLLGDDFDPRLADRARELSQATQRVAQERGVLFVDPAEVAPPGDDGIHLGVESHGRLAELVAATILDSG